MKQGVLLMVLSFCSFATNFAMERQPLNKNQKSIIQLSSEKSVDDDLQKMLKKSRCKIKELKKLASGNHSVADVNRLIESIDEMDQELQQGSQEFIEAADRNFTKIISILLQIGQAKEAQFKKNKIR